MYSFVNWFVKITGYIPQKILLRIKVYYEDNTCSRMLHGPVVIISNHTALFDYAICLFVFYTRTLRFQMAELLFKKFPLGIFLKLMGGIKVDRFSKDFSFMNKSLSILKKGGIVGIFPESRLPKKDEKRPLEFKESAALIALSAGVNIVPIYTNGSYFKKERARVIIGKTINPLEIIKDEYSEKENIKLLTDYLYQNTVRLGKILDEKSKG